MLTGKTQKTHLILEKFLHMQKNENPAVAMKKRRTFSKINALAIQHYENTEYRQIALYSLNAEIELDFFFPNHKHT